MEAIDHIMYNFWLKLAGYENGVITIGATSIPGTPRIERLTRELEVWRDTDQQARPDGSPIFAHEIWNRKVCALNAALILEPEPGEE